jgi:hypothetical protein
MSHPASTPAQLSLNRTTRWLTTSGLWRVLATAVWLIAGCASRPAALIALSLQALVDPQSTRLGALVQASAAAGTRNDSFAL